MIPFPAVAIATRLGGHRLCVLHGRRRAVSSVSSLAAGYYRSPLQRSASHRSISTPPTTTIPRIQHPKRAYYHYSTRAMSLATSIDTATRATSSPENAESDDRPEKNNNGIPATTTTTTIRLSKLLSHHSTNLGVSRRSAEALIRDGQVTVAGNVIVSPHFLVNSSDLMDDDDNDNHNQDSDASSNTLGNKNNRNHRVVVKVQGKGLQLNLNSLLSTTTGDLLRSDEKEAPIVYAVHKLAGEVVTERDPKGRPSMLDRLKQGGVGSRRYGGNKKMMAHKKMHLKPIGRLDVPTEGLILVTNDGEFAREMELPQNKIHRVYRARVHGKLTPNKLERIRKGGIRSLADGTRYGPMKVSVERNGGRGTNSWVQLTTTEGKNRMVRNVFAALGGKKSNASDDPLGIGNQPTSHLFLLLVFNDSYSDQVDSDWLW